MPINCTRINRILHNLCDCCRQTLQIIVESFSWLVIFLAVLCMFAVECCCLLNTSAAKCRHSALVCWSCARCHSGYDDDFIKLYDLTTLCSNLVDDVTTNPFTVPVGILLYRVARNMRMHGRQKSNIVRSLLEKCLLLLDAVKHAQVIRSAPATASGFCCSRIKKTLVGLVLLHFLGSAAPPLW